MAYSTYLELVNAVRDRMNEPHLTSGNFATVVGFDQFCKDAINYAYHDILNAEMEWPFLHQAVTQQTTPGVQFYNYTPGSAPYTIKTIDWDSFYLSNNKTTTTITNEVHTVSSTSPYIVTPTNIVNWSTDLGVKYGTDVALTPVMGDPTTGQYTIINGIYYFGSGDAGVSTKVTYQTAVSPVIASLEPATMLKYIDYDYWRSVFLARDLNNLSTSQYGQPQMVFKTQNQGRWGITPVPDKFYTVNFEAWLDVNDMSATTDAPVFPSRFNQIIVDGAQKYCYEFREDPQSAQMVDVRFKKGIDRMRIELINRSTTMQTGMFWYPRGYSNSGSSM